MAETSIWLGGDLSGDPKLRDATSGTAQTRGTWSTAETPRRA
jgi:hypothetical protein